MREREWFSRIESEYEDFDFGGGWGAFWLDTYIDGIDFAKIELIIIIQYKAFYTIIKHYSVKKNRRS